MSIFGLGTMVVVTALTLLAYYLSGDSSCEGECDRSHGRNGVVKYYHVFILCFSPFLLIFYFVLFIHFFFKEIAKWLCSRDE